MARQYKQTAAGSVPEQVWRVSGTSQEALRMTSLGQAMADVLASSVFAAGTMGVILVMGTLAYAGWKGSWIWSTPAAEKLILATIIPWLLVFVRFLDQAVKNINLTRYETGYTNWFKGAYVPEQPIREAHLVPVFMPESTLDGLPISMIVEFCEQIPHRGWSKSSWVSVYRFDNGLMCDYPTWKGLCTILEKALILVNRGERKKGLLRVTEPLEMLRRLRLSQYAYLLKIYHDINEPD